MQSPADLLQRAVVLNQQRRQIEQEERLLLINLLEQVGVDVAFLAPLPEGQWTATLTLRPGAPVRTDSERTLAVAPPPPLDPPPLPQYPSAPLVVETGPLSRGADLPPAAPMREEGVDRRQPPAPVAPAVGGATPTPELARTIETPAPVRQVARSIEELRAMSTAGGLRVQHRGAPRPNPLRHQSGDKRARAIRMARTFASDIIAYRPDDHRQAVIDGVTAIAERFAADIQKAKGRFEEQVSQDEVNDRDLIFREAINELLGKGQAVL